VRPVKATTKIKNSPKGLIAFWLKIYEAQLKSVSSQDNCDETFLNSISNEFLTNFLSLFNGELKYLLYVMNKVVSATKIPKNPSNNIGELGKSYTGTSMSFRKLRLI